MTFDFEALSSKIEIATRLAFTRICEQHRAEGIYAFALYSDDGAMTVCAAANTKAHLEQAEQDELTYYKFAPAEWKYEGSGFDEADALFDEICTLVREREGEAEEDDGQFVTFRSTLFATCIDVLKKLAGEGIFQEIAGHEVGIVFTASEYEFPKAEMRKIVSSLNDNSYKDEYLAWMKTWG